MSQFGVTFLSSPLLGQVSGKGYIRGSKVGLSGVFFPFSWWEMGLFPKSSCALLEGFGFLLAFAVSGEPFKNGGFGLFYLFVLYFFSKLPVFCAAALPIALPPMLFGGTALFCQRPSF